MIDGQLSQYAQLGATVVITMGFITYLKWKSGKDIERDRNWQGFISDMHTSHEKLTESTGKILTDCNRTMGEVAQAIKHCREQTQRKELESIAKKGK